MLRNGLEPSHLIIILVAVVLLFGAKRLPDTARALGKSLRILKSETRALKDDFKEGAAEGSSPPASARGDGHSPTQRTIQGFPGDTASARPVNESAAGQQR